MTNCRICESQTERQDIDYCGVCMAVLPHIAEMPNGRSIRSVQDEASKFRADLGNPCDRLRQIWEAVRKLPDRHDIAWLFSGVQNNQEWRWITSPPPPLEFDDASMRFLADRMAIYRNEPESLGVMRTLQRGGLLPSGHFLSWSGGQWSLDGKVLDVPHVLLWEMIRTHGNRADINWGRLLRTIDLAVTRVVDRRNDPVIRTRGNLTMNPAFYLLNYRRSHHHSSFSPYKRSVLGMEMHRITSSRSDFGNASWLESWSMEDTIEPMFTSQQDFEGAMQQSSLRIKKGKLVMRVRRPGGAFRQIQVPPHPDLVARLTSWFLSNPSSKEFRRMECLRTRIFAGEGATLVEGPERTALKLLRSVFDTIEGCTLGPDGRSFLVSGTSGLFYDVRSCPRGMGPHGSRFRIRCLGPYADRPDRSPRWARRTEDICIRESNGPRLPLGDLMVQAILTVSQDQESASRGIASIGAAIQHWQASIERRNQEDMRREDPVGAHFRHLERLAGRMRRDWMHRRLRRATASFPALWSTMIRAPLGSMARFTSLENASREPGRPNIVFEGISTRFRTESRIERQIVRAMLLGSGWTRQRHEEITTGIMQIWRRTTRSDDDDLQRSVTDFCRLLDNLVTVNGRRLPLAPQNLEVGFEADSEVYDNAILPGSRGLIA